MKKLFAAMLALSTVPALTGPAQAQLTGQHRQKTMLQVEEEQKKNDAAKAQKEYEAAMRKNQGEGADQSATDPWANMRAVDGSQPKR